MKLSKILLLVVIFFASILNGCVGTASFGSKGEIIDKEAVNKLTTVKIMPLTITKDDMGINILLSDSIMAMYKRELNSRDLFKILAVDSADQINSKEYTLSNEAELKGNLRFYSLRGQGVNATLTLSISSNAAGKVFLFCSHDTFAGNSYFLPPSVDTITKDVIEGAINKLEDLLKDN